MEERFVFCSRRQIKPAGSMPETNNQETTRSVWNLVRKFRVGRAGKGPPVEDKMGRSGEDKEDGRVLLQLNSLSYFFCTSLKS